jgi:hypothetical protein
MIVITEQVFCGEIEATRTYQFETVAEAVEFLKYVNNESAQAG